ncbi:MAG: restriction endonuclease subunit S [Cyclobacteriaceae bacterium]|nr:restriction endonuclease subunit S [Cyclobacteriaceae bacterium]
MSNRFGFTETDIEAITAVLEMTPTVDKAIIFGSRAKGNYKPGSDVDIALKGSAITFDDVAAISYQLNEETRLPYKFDLLNYHTIKEPELKAHIDRVGIEFYSRWKKYNLGELVELVTKGTTPTTIGGGFISQGVNFIKSEAVGHDGRIDKSTFVFISEETHQKLRRSQLQKDDILFSMAGIFLGKNAMVTDDMLPANTNQALAIIRINKKIALPKYIHYYLRQRNVIDLVNNMSGQSAQPNINFEEIKSIEILLPPLSEQTAITSILSSLDDKIDLLHRQNKTLEQLAETLFRQWFVEEAEESWEVKELIQLGSIICGKTPSKKNHSFFGGEIPFIKIPDMHGKIFLFESEDSLTVEGANSQKNKLLPPKSICVSCIATVGLVSINVKPSQTNQQINSIVPSKDFYRYFIYLKMKFLKDELLAMASGGTATDNLNTGNFAKIKFAVPDDERLQRFHSEVKSLFDKIYSNSIQIRALINLRNTILPKLMSGEVRVQLSET